MFERDADVSTIAAFEGTKDAQRDDAEEFSQFLDSLFLDPLQPASGEIAAMSLGTQSNRLLTLSSTSVTEDGSRRTAREARRGSPDTVFVAVAPAAVESDSGTYTERCVAGGEFSVDFVTEEELKDGFFREEGTFTWSFNDCATNANGKAVVLNGSWIASYDYEDSWTVSQAGVETGKWTEAATNEVDLRGTIDGIEDAMVLVGSIETSEAADYVWSDPEYSEKGTLTIKVPSLEARLLAEPGRTVYLGQLDTSVTEDFDYQEISLGGDSFSWTEDSTILVAGRVASSGMDGSLRSSTQKAIKSSDSSAATGEFCPSEGIVVISGAEGFDAEIRFGADTGTTGVAAQVVTVGDFASYVNCNEVDDLELLILGPLSAIMGGAEPQ
ncbi:MAG: hypothetical protein EA346_11235 [Thioalkalivibrio sp.]|nr:MAG: hypothetical protein EA346_11235 [Thioalkalivibrio sp.]